MDAKAEATRRSLPVLAGEAIARASSRAPARAVRLSITDRCDLACTYCRPSRHDRMLPSHLRLAAGDWETLVRALVGAGVERVRITGGEPLVHPDVVEIVARIAKIPGVRDLALTTNGTRLAALARPLREAGLRRVNVSVDSLVAERFWRLTRGGRLDDVLEGIEAARAVGFEELKTNTVVIASAPGEVGNEDELVDLTRWAWSIGATPRFLELMAIGEAARDRARFVSSAAVRARLSALIEPALGGVVEGRGPARYAVARDGSGRVVGFIAGSSATFCDGCDRLRVTSDGRLRSCLASGDAVDVRAAIDAHDEDAIALGVATSWAGKPDGRAWRGCEEASAAEISMRATGG